PSRDMTTPAAAATGAARATPTQNTGMLPAIRPIAPTTKPARARITAVQAAGVLPWFADIGWRLLQGRAYRLILDVGPLGRVAAVVQGAPPVSLCAWESGSVVRLDPAGAVSRT